MNRLLPSIPLLLVLAAGLAAPAHGSKAARAAGAAKGGEAADADAAANAGDGAAGRKGRAKKRTAGAPSTGGAETLSYGRFGEVYVYRQTPHPKNVVLFFSGDGGWNLGVVDMARTLAGLDAMVVGINLPRYEKQLNSAHEPCAYPAADLELLSKYVQKKLGFPSYVPPVLVGYSSGATLAYAVLVEAPPNTFRGAVSMGFCPDLPLVHPLCAGHGLTWGPGPKGKGYSFKPATNLEQPWIAFQGEIDQVCFPKDVEDYVKQVKEGELVLLPKVGHGFSVPAHWVPQFKEAFQKMTASPAAGAAAFPAPAPAASAASGGSGVPAAPAGAPPPPNPAPAGAKPSAPAGPAPPPGAAPPPVADLPLIEVPSHSPGDLLAVILSGDGGWAGLDREVAQGLTAKGLPVVGLNCLQYFWSARTPQGASADLARILRHYLAAWNRRQVLLVGYSLGADVLPFMLDRLPADLQSRVRLVALLAPSRKASFEFHLSDWLGNEGGDLPVLPEVAKLRGKPLLCLYGDEESDSLCTEIGTLGKAVSFHGSHHLGGDYGTVAERILREVQPPAAAGK